MSQLHAAKLTVEHIFDLRCSHGTTISDVWLQWSWTMAHITDSFLVWADGVATCRVVHPKVPIPHSWSLAVAVLCWCYYVYQRTAPHPRWVDKVKNAFVGLLMPLLTVLALGIHLVFNVVPDLATALWAWLQYVSQACTVCVTWVGLWLQDFFPVVTHVLKRAWAHVSKVLWVLVAADLMSFPWQFQHLDEHAEGLALLLPALQLVGAHVLLVRNRPTPAGPDKRALQPWIGRAGEVQFCLGVALAVNWLFLTAAAVLAGGIFQTDVAQGGKHVRITQLHLLVHFALSCVYALTAAAVDVIVTSRSAHELLNSWVAGLCRLRRAVGSQLHSAAVLCKNVVSTVMQVTVCRPLSALAACWRRLLGSCCRCLSQFVDVAVQAQAQLCAHALERMHRVYATCSAFVQAVLAYITAVPAAALQMLACMTHACLAQAAAAWTRGKAKGVQQRTAAVGSSQQLLLKPPAPSQQTLLDSPAPSKTPPAAAPAKKHMKQQHYASHKPHECVVCEDAYRSVAMFPCGHIVVCDHCIVVLQKQAKRVSEDALACCPICRSKVQHYESGLILAWASALRELHCVQCTSSLLHGVFFLYLSTYTCHCIGELVCMLFQDLRAVVWAFCTVVAMLCTNTGCCECRPLFVASINVQRKLCPEVCDVHWRIEKSALCCHTRSSARKSLASQSLVQAKTTCAQAASQKPKGKLSSDIFPQGLLPLRRDSAVSMTS